MQRICFKEQNFSVKTFAYTKSAYRTVSNFNNAKFEKLPKAKLLTELEISTFGLSDDLLLELAAATYGDRFYNESTFSQQILVVSRLKGRIVKSMLK